MKRWYNRNPETMQDWLLLFAVAAALLAAVWYLPAIAAALRVLLGLATPFAGGLALAYVLDIPARWFAIHLFGGRRGPGILLAYLALFGTVAALVGLVVPQLVQSVGSFAAALPGYLENAQALLELVQANYGVDTTSLSELLLNSGSSVESFLSGLPGYPGALALDEDGILYVSYRWARSNWLEKNADRTLLRSIALRAGENMQQKLFGLSADAPCAEAMDTADGSWERTFTGREMDGCTAVCPAGSKVYFGAAGSASLLSARV